MEKISASKLLAGLVPADFIREEVQVELVTTDSREVREYSSALLRFFRSSDVLNPK